LEKICDSHIDGIIDRAIRVGMIGNPVTGVVANSREQPEGAPPSSPMRTITDRAGFEEIGEKKSAETNKRSTM